MDKEQEALIFYIDDNGETTSCYAIIISKENNLISFRPISGKNIITIPNHRLLKIKEKTND